MGRKNSYRADPGFRGFSVLVVANTYKSEIRRSQEQLISSGKKSKTVGNFADQQGREAELSRQRNDGKEVQEEGR